MEYTGHWRVGCNYCGCRTGVKISIKEAIKSWNHRRASDAEIELLKAENQKLKLDVERNCRNCDPLDAEQAIERCARIIAFGLGCCQVTGHICHSKGGIECLSEISSCLHHQEDRADTIEGRNGQCLKCWKTYIHGKRNFSGDFRKNGIIKKLTEKKDELKDELEKARKVGINK